MNSAQADNIVECARGWLGTPYVHQCSTRGQGADCLGLLRGVWLETIGPEPVQVPAYTSDWSECSGQEVLLSAAREHLIEVPLTPISKGHVVLFRMQRSAVAKHLAIVATGPMQMPTIIHAYSGRGVVETPLTDRWMRKIIAQFQYPIGSN